MRKIFCFIDELDNSNRQLSSFVETLDSMGDEVYLFTNIYEQEDDSCDVLYTIDTIINKQEEKVPYIFLSNVENLFQIIYRVYHQIFDNFIYYQQEEAREYHLGGIFKTISNMQVSESEMLYKPVYTNNIELVLKKFNCEVLKYEALLEPNNDIAKLPIYRSEDRIITHELVRKYYYINEIYYLFEPVLTEKKVVIRDLKNVNENRSSFKQEFYYPGFNGVQYAYNYNKELFNKLFTMLDHISNKNLEEIYHTLETMDMEMKEYFPFVYYMTCCILDDAAQLDDENNILRSLMLFSFLMQVTKKPYYLNLLLKTATKSNILTCYNRYFIWNQCKRYLFTNKVAGDSDTNMLMKELYDKIFKEYQDELAEELYCIPREERNENVIAIFTIQFLSERHAPTRTTLERCYTLAKSLGKKIMLINTKEQYTRKGGLPLYNPTFGKVIEEYSGNEYYQYKDLKIPFYQPSEDMPNVTVIRQMIKKMRELKPAFIFSIGDGSIAADLCGKIVPEAAIGLVFSALPTTVATFSVIGRKIAKSEWEQLIEKGYQKDNIIESTFTFELNPQKKTIVREDFSIPKERFVLVTVGIRLDSEIDEDYIQTIRKTFPWGTHIVFAGYFEQYEYYCRLYSDFKEHSTFIGYYDDILALMEICDLYVNPRRLGGGFSIIEAFHQSKPGVTIHMGDVSVAAGKEFCVSDYQEMAEMIHRYIEDKEFYNSMARKARDREKIVTDSAFAMESIIKNIQENRLYF